MELAAGASADGLLAALVRADVGLSRFELIEPSLQSIFIARVGGAVGTAPVEELAHV